jgi:hypothetical protein
MTTGACRCGAVIYRIAGTVLPPVYVCHCRDCQTWSGSAFSEHALLPKDAVTFEGETVAYCQHREGGTSEHVFCKSCFTRLFNRNSAVPGMIILRAGTIDASHRISPVAHIWVRRKQPWVSVPEDVPSWLETPTPEEFGAALQ